LAEVFKALASIVLCGMGLDSEYRDFVNDFMPIVVIVGKHSGRAKTANELCNKEYRASKDM